MYEIILCQERARALSGLVFNPKYIFGASKTLQMKTINYLYEYIVELQRPLVVIAVARYVRNHDQGEILPKRQGAHD